MLDSGMSVHALRGAHCAAFPSCTGVLNEKIAAIVQRQVTQDDVPLLFRIHMDCTWSWLTYCTDEVA